MILKLYNVEFQFCKKITLGEKPGRKYNKLPTVMISGEWDYR